MDADNLARQGVSTSPIMILTLLNRNNLVTHVEILGEHIQTDLQFPNFNTKMA